LATPTGRSKIFGVPFDPPNSPERLNLKIAYISHLIEISNSSAMFSDPYDVIEADLKGVPLLAENHWLGKMPIDSWLTPRPTPEDLALLTPFQDSSFLEENGCWDYAQKVAQFVEEQVFPYSPVMIGIDHSSTGGVLLALAKKYENLNVVVMDAHFDVMKGNDLFSSFKSNNRYDEPLFYHCGNFLSFMLEKEIIRPKNLWVLGVNEEMMPKRNSMHNMGTFTNNENEARRWVDNGVHLVSKEMVSSGRVCIDLNGPTYVSIDMDVGSLTSVFSARFMNCYGLTFQEFIHLLNAVSKSIKKASVPLVGLDIMELDIHFLDASEGLPFQDHARDMVKKTLKTLLTDEMK